MANTPRPSVYLIDDADDALPGYQQVLGDAGFLVRAAADPWVAYHEAVVAPPSVFVIDVRMPGPLDGIELTRKLRHNEATRAVPIIVLTGYAGDDTLAEAARAGAALFLTKPCPPDVLLAAIRQVLSSGPTSRA